MGNHTLSDPFGFLNIDKPQGMTSHDVVACIRRGLKFKKVGHAGTLDPMATGVLVICLGRATRLSEYAMRSRKRYRAVVALGAATTTYDAEGDVVSQQDGSGISREEVESALANFRGEIAQLPPMYSAIKRNGRKLYELAREGQEVEREARQVTIHALTLTEWSAGQFMLDVECSPGTYIRSLAHDLGQTVGVGAHLSGLARTASGAFTLDQAVDLDTAVADWPAHVMPPDTPILDMPAVRLDSTDTDHILHGRVVRIQSEGERTRAYNAAGEFLAILKKIDDGVWRPDKVFFSHQSELR